MALQKPGDAGEGLHEDLRHFLALQITRRQNKRRDARLHKRQPFNMSIPDAMVFGQDDPIASSRLGEPVFVFCVGGKVIVVDVECGAGLTERSGDTVLPQRPIEEEDRLVRPLRRRVRT